MIVVSATFLGLLPILANPHQKEITAEVKVEMKIKYLLYLPEGYETSKKDWPLVLFLHGAGERGDDLKKVSQQGLPKMLKNGMNLPCIVISPQCSKNSRWTNPVEQSALIALIDEIEKKYRVDTSRVYLTGLSMGGFGAWKLASDHPDRFAAVAPVCGGGDPSKAAKLKNTPIWVFHGARDLIVPKSESETMVEAIKKAGGDPKYTLYPKAGHDAWSPTYANPEFYKWMFDQKLEK